MDWAEAEGKTFEEAVDALLKALGADKSEVEIEDLGRQRKFLGLGSEVVKIRGKLKKESFQDFVVEKTVKTVDEPPDVTSEEADRSKDFLMEILSKMGIAGADVNVKKEGKFLTLDIQSTAGGLLIGKRGETLEALQTVLDIFASRLKGEKSHIVIDTENYRERRRDKLQELAHNSASRAVKEKRKVPLGSMKASERKIIHTCLKDNSQVRTESEGSGDSRQVVIFPVR